MGGEEWFYDFVKKKELPGISGKFVLNKTYYISIKYPYMRLLIFAACVLITSHIYAQEDFGWIAPEGKILNYRTLTWADFLGKEEKEFATSLAERNLVARAYVCPAIYFKADSGERIGNGRVKFSFHVKCAFQSKAFVRESTKQEHSNYVLIHEQDHYDISLNYANKLQAELSSRDYSEANYSAEVNKVYNDLLDKHNRTQETYDNDVNPDGREEKEKQYLWDMRIKKCLENNTDEYYSSNENAVQNVKVYGTTVKRIPGEPALQFVVRARPLYTEFPQEMTSKVLETREWTPGEPSIIAFYTQKYYVEEDGGLPRYNFRTLAYMFIPNAKDTYKRVFIDTFSVDGRQVNITSTFFTNVDSDQAKELIITATCPQRDAQANGMLYINRVYDNISKPLPVRLKKLNDAAAKIEGGFEGISGGKPSKAKYKNEKEITEALKKIGYN